MKCTKIISGIAIASSVFAFGIISAHAAPASDAFDVTVPVSLPVSISANGTITTATDVKISNNCSNGKTIGISQIDVTSSEGWALVPYGAGTIDQNKVDQKITSLSVNGEEVHTTQKGSAETIVSHSAGSFGSMTANAGDSMPIAYDVEIGPQTETLTDVTVMSVVFTIDYAPLDEPLPNDPENTGSSTYCQLLGY